MGKSFFNSIKSAFVTEVETDNSISSVSVNKPEKEVYNEPKNASNLNTNNVPEKIEGVVDNDLLGTLCSVLENSEEMKSDFPSYLDLKSAVNDDVMRKSISDENVRFTCAFVSMKVNNSSLTKEKIINSIDKCIELIENERSVGMSQLSEAKKESVDDKEIEINEKAKELAKKQEEIAKLAEEISSLKTGVINSKNELAMKNANFNETVNFLIENLKKDKEKLLNILN